MRRSVIAVLALGIAGCTLVTDSSQFLTDGSVMDADTRVDAGLDAGLDAGDVDAEGFDAGPPPADAGPMGPDVVILSSTVPDGGTTETSRVEITFVANPASMSDEFECQLESVTAGGTDSTGFVACTSPQTYELLEAGLHTFSVRARNAATGFGMPQTRMWTLEARGVGIRDIQEGLAMSTFEEETLVTVNARVQHDFAAAGGFPRAVVLADAGGSVAASAWHGIFTEPRDGGETSFAEGTEVTIVGTVREIDATTWIVGATYTRGAVNSPYAFANTRDGNELVQESMEGLVVDVSGEVPTNFNCTSCTGSPSGPNCFETCRNCRPSRHRDLTGQRDYGDFGFYTGAVLAGGRELWMFAFTDSSDACL